MRPSLIPLIAAAATLVVAPLALVACGDSSPATPSPPSANAALPVRTVHVVLPTSQKGGDPKDMVEGMRLALADEGAVQGGVRVEIKVHDDSGADGNTDINRTVAATREVVADPNAIGILGPFNSSATVAMAPVANRASIPIIGVNATAVRLTRRPDGTPGPPLAMAPRGVRNFVRVVPNDNRQAYALVQNMVQENVDVLSILHDGEVYGRGISKTVAENARAAGIRVNEIAVITDANAAGVARDAAVALETVAKKPGMFIVSNTDTMSVAAVRAAANTSFRLRIFGPDSMALRGVYPHFGGKIERRVYITTYLLPVGNYGPAGVQVYQRLTTLIGHTPTPTALYAYEAMSLMLHAIGVGIPTAAAAATPIVTQRKAVTRVLFSTVDRASVVGTYSIDQNGDTTSALFGAYRVESAELVRGQAIDTGAAP